MIMIEELANFKLYWRSSEYPITKNDTYSPELNPNAIFGGGAYLIKAMSIRSPQLMTLEFLIYLAQLFQEKLEH